MDFHIIHTRITTCSIPTKEIEIFKNLADLRKSICILVPRIAGRFVIPLSCYENVKNIFLGK